MLISKALSLALGLGVTESYTAGRSSVRGLASWFRGASFDTGLICVPKYAHPTRTLSFDRTVLQLDPAAILNR